MTRRTLSEIASTSLKAARGAGCPWGLAEEAAMAVRVLESHGLPGVADLAALLSSKRLCGCSGCSDGPVCGIAALATLSDRLADVSGDGVSLGSVSGARMLPAVLWLDARETGAIYRLQIDELACLVSANGMDADGDLPRDGHVRVTRELAPGNPVQASPESRSLPSEAWDCLETLAARTLVPETDASRQTGAGPDAADRD
jgi:hypothetical protein